MKKTLIVVLAVALVLGASSAAFANKENVGCGLGSMIFADNMDTTLFQIFAVTTNGIFGNQTFGITSGTLECDMPASFVSNERLNEFVAANMDDLAHDIAMGSGEALDTVAELMHIPRADRTEAYSALKGSFASIFTSDDVTSAAVIDNIHRVLTTA